MYVFSILTTIESQFSLFTLLRSVILKRALISLLQIRTTASQMFFRNSLTSRMTHSDFFIIQKETNVAQQFIVP